jgi:hypothetical protein
MTQHNRFLTRSLRALPVLLVVALSACGGGSDEAASAGVPTLPPPPSSTADAAASGSDASSVVPAADVTPQERSLAMAKCIREHGVEDFPDPQFDDDGGIAMQAPPDDPDLPAAASECADILGPVAGAGVGAGPSQEQIAETQSKAMEITECMREHGVDFGDPIVQDNGAVEMQPGADVDRNGSEYQAAEAACGALSQSAQP